MSEVEVLPGDVAAPHGEHRRGLGGTADGHRTIASGDHDPYVMSSVDSAFPDLGKPATWQSCHFG